MNRILAIISLVISIISGFYCLQSLLSMHESIKEWEETITDSTINASIVSGGIKLSLFYSVFF